MDKFISSLPGLAPSVALALIFWRILNQALDFHRRSLHEQRRDLLEHMAAVCRSPRPPVAQAARPPVLPAAAALLLLLAAGCKAGQGGSVGDFNLTTPLGSVAFRTWTVTPVAFTAADVGGSTPLQPPTPSTRPAATPAPALAAQ